MTLSRPASSREVRLSELSDRDLLRELHAAVARDRQVEADLLGQLAEVDARKLYLEEACPSMFAYCTLILHFSEATAYHRIQAARAARTYPILLDRIRRGEIHLSGVRLLSPHLTPENHADLLDRTRHKSKRAIEQLLADRAPKPDAPSSVRRLPQKGSGAAWIKPLDSNEPSEASKLEEVGSSGRDASAQPSPPAPAPVPRSERTHPEPLGRERFKIQFTASRELCRKLRDAQALLRHQIPGGDLAEIFDRALTLLVEDAKRRRFAQTSRPATRDAKEGRLAGSGPASRHIPAEIKRRVTARDRGSCTFVARSGRRCESRDFLEFHHKQPWARSRRHSVDGIELRCRAHNHHAALQDYGAEHMGRWLGSTRKDPRAPTRPGAS